MELARLEIKNIKISLILHEELKDLPNQKIIKHNNAVITFYPSNKRIINVTKLKTLNELYQIQNEIQSLFNVKVKKLKIDAIMLSRRVMNKRFSLKKMLKTLEKYKDLFKCDYHPELFHSPWFKSRDGKHGSFNVFTTGSSTVMGVKCVEPPKISTYMI